VVTLFLYIPEWRVGQSLRRLQVQRRKPPLRIQSGVQSL